MYKIHLNCFEIFVFLSQQHLLRFALSIRQANGSTGIERLENLINCEGFVANSEDNEIQKEIPSVEEHIVEEITVRAI